ncbi:hypothetical protein VTL71DRAFT_10937 [Oculimacula yallundae]|uniref:P-loop containing nucleoside triphosphate hydrolase protein n=1 Tax=Oculimacula yallundae TaxID=86028 RepID=A0ABR4CVX3_9HELO
MEAQVDRLVEKTWAKYKTLPPDGRLLIAISGIPGSGKTTLAKTLTTCLNDLSSTSSTTASPIATYIPMDGFHHPLSHLHSLPDPTHALARRGAPFTFDSSAYLTLVRSLRSPLSPDPPTPTIHAPSFSHTTKDPISNSIPIPATSKILIFEGNYLSLSTPPPPSTEDPNWRLAGDLMDEHWFVDVEEDIAARRLVKRHVKSGVAPDEEEAWKRVRENDLLNGRDLIKGRREGIDEFVVSREDDGWRAEGEE